MRTSTIIFAGILVEDVGINPIRNYKIITNNSGCIIGSEVWGHYEASFFIDRNLLNNFNLSCGGKYTLTIINGDDYVNISCRIISVEKSDKENYVSIGTDPEIIFIFNQQ